MHITYKVTTWIKAEIESGSISKDELIEKLSVGLSPSEVIFDKIDNYENIVETEEWMSSEENNNKPTIELYSDGGVLLWNNTK